MKRRTILVTGSSGKLGAAVVRTLSGAHDIVQMDMREPDDPGQRAIGRLATGSITDPAAVAAAFEGVDTVIHCAAIPWNIPPNANLLNVNVGGTVTLLDEAGARAAVEQFIFISTIRVHGVLEAIDEAFMPRFLPFDETHPLLAMEYYGGGKCHAEHWCRMYVRRFGKPVVTFRPAYILPIAREAEFVAQPAPDHPALLDYVATSDFIEAIRLSLDYHPQDGFDRFLAHAPDQRSATPSLELVDRFFPSIPVDREKLSACGGYGAFVDCSHACEKLGWQRRYQARRP
jgi:nucleoside-diphosphate-sugar epimerase